MPTHIPRPTVIEAAGNLRKRIEEFAGRVVQAAGPWRVQGDWWSDGSYARDYYDAQLSDGCIYRLYCDLETRSWFVDGVYD